MFGENLVNVEHLMFSLVDVLISRRTPVPS